MSPKGMTSCPSVSIYSDTGPQKEARPWPNGLGEKPHSSPFPKAHGNHASWPKHMECRSPKKAGWPCNKRSSFTCQAQLGCPQNIIRTHPLMLLMKRKSIIHQFNGRMQRPWYHMKIIIAIWTLAFVYLIIIARWIFFSSHLIEKQKFPLVRYQCYKPW